jgi:PST family polysaccharide transporter
MVSTVVLARLVSPGDFGLVSMVTAFSLLLMSFGANGFTEAVIQQENLNHWQISTLFWINLGISMVLAMSFMAFAPIIARFYGEPRLRQIAIVMSFTIVFMALSNQHTALMKRNMQFVLASANDLSAAIIGVVIAIVLALQGWGYWAVAARQVTVTLVTVVGSWILCRWRPGLPRLRTGIRPMLKYAMQVYGNYAVTYVERHLDKVLVGRFHGPQSLGNYDRAYHLFGMPINQLSAPLTNVALSTLSKLRNDRERFVRYYLNAISILAFIGMLVSAVLTLIGRDLILVLLGSQWTKAGVIFSALGPSIGIALIYITQGWLHLSLGRADRWLRWSIVSLATTGTSFVIGVQFGALGVAIAYTASFYLMFGPALWYAGKPINLKLSSIISEIWRYFVSALGAGLLTWIILYSVGMTSEMFIRTNVFVRIAISALLCTSVYLILIIGLYKGTQPISQFLGLIGQMIPAKFGQKIGQHAGAWGNGTNL